MKNEVRLSSAFHTLQLTTQELTPHYLLNLECLYTSNVKELVTYGKSLALDTLDDLLFPVFPGEGKLFIINNTVNKFITFKSRAEMEWIVCLIEDGKKSGSSPFFLDDEVLSPMKHKHIKTRELTFRMPDSDIRTSRLYIYTNWQALQTEIKI